tara:strand:+ start:159 stop:431 length:273 start_codon:yes stop_codon:yes gene_type:complete
VVVELVYRQEIVIKMELMVVPVVAEAVVIQIVQVDQVILLQSLRLKETMVVVMLVVLLLQITKVVEVVVQQVLVNPHKGQLVVVVVLELV